jgi:hypothetical protein
MFWLAIIGVVLASVVYAFVWFASFFNALLNLGVTQPPAGAGAPDVLSASSPADLADAETRGSTTAVAPPAAAQVVRAFVRGSYNAATWEDMVARRSPDWGPPLIEALGLVVPDTRRDACAFAAAFALRERFNRESFSPATWRSKRWSDAEVSELLDIVSERVRATAVLSPPVPSAPRRVTGSPSPSATEWGEFAPWVSFAERGDVSSSPGVYVFGLFSADVPAVVDPVARDVIYVGMAAKQSLALRLSQFQDTALGGSGHSAGWTYRHEIGRGDWDRLVEFRDTFVTWRVVRRDEAVAPRTIERAIIARYECRWGALPRINRVR